MSTLKTPDRDNDKSVKILRFDVLRLTEINHLFFAVQFDTSAN